MGDSARIIGTGVTQVFDWNMKSTKRYTINPGGTSSSKTVSILQVLIMLAREFKPGAKNNVVTVTAESLPALKAGAIRDFEEIIAKPPFSGYIKRYTVSPHKAILHNGAAIEFRAFKDVKTAHHGKRRILFINEANNMNYAVCRQLMMRSRRIFMDFNPTSEFWAHQKFQGHPEAQWIYSTYKHNAFTPKETIAEILALKHESPGTIPGVWSWKERQFQRADIHRRSDHSLTASSFERSGLRTGFGLCELPYGFG